MAHRSYEKGAAFERQVQKRLEEGGFRCIRSAGSHSIIDLICGKRGAGRKVIQCRLRGNLTEEEERELRECAKDFDAQAILAYRQGKELWFRNI